MNNTNTEKQGFIKTLRHNKDYIVQCAESHLLAEERLDLWRRGIRRIPEHFRKQLRSGTRLLPSLM